MRFSCSRAGIWHGEGILRGVGGFWMSSGHRRCFAPTTNPPKTWRSRRARWPGIGKTSSRNAHRKTLMALERGGSENNPGSVFPTSKHGTSHYGTRNHINLDRKHQLIRRYHRTDAAVHGSQAVDQFLTRGNTGFGVWADAAWRSAGIEAVVSASKLTNHIHRMGQRVKPLTGQASKSNRTKSLVRIRVGHIFGAQVVEPGGTLVRTIGVVSGCSNRWRDPWRLRAKARIGTPNLACNMRRLGQLGRLNPPDN